MCLTSVLLVCVSLLSCWWPTPVLLVAISLLYCLCVSNCSAAGGHLAAWQLMFVFLLCCWRPFCYCATGVWLVTVFLVAVSLCSTGGHWKNASDSEHAAAQHTASTVPKTALLEVTGEVTGSGNATTEAVTLSRGSEAEGPSRGHHGLQLQCTEIAGDENNCAGGTIWMEPV